MPEQWLDGGSNLGWFVRLGDGNLNFVQSAIEVLNPDIKEIDETFVKLLDYNPKEPASGFSADMYTWIRPTALQEADALKIVTRQTWTDLASILDDYNNGYIGPGYCME